MKSFMRTTLIILIILGNLSWIVDVAARSPSPANNNQLISKGQAISSVKNELKGKVLSIQLIPSEGQPVYKVKLLLSKGRVRTVFVDGFSGQVIRIR